MSKDDGVFRGIINLGTNKSSRQLLIVVAEICYIEGEKDYNCIKWYMLNALRYVKNIWIFFFSIKSLIFRRGADVNEQEKLSNCTLQIKMKIKELRFYYCSRFL